MEITNQNLVQLSNNVRNVPCAHLFDALVYLPAFLNELLPAGFPLHSELTVPTLGTVVCKTEEVEGFRLAFSSLPPVVLCKSAKFQQSALVFLKSQSKVSHSAFQGIIELLRLCLILEANHKVVCLDYDSVIAFHTRHDPIPKPPEQDIVHVDVGDYG